MARSSRAREDFDSPWKDALHLYLQHFLAFFFPAIHGDIDWTHSYESLDKEFQQIIRRAKVGKGLADKLFKVWLRDGSQTWLLIHVEIQGTYEADFSERMFRYNVAAYTLYNREVVSLAIMCDDDPAWQPDSFAYGRWGSHTGIQFLTAKLLGYGGNLASLETAPNPFAAVVLAHLQALATRGNPRSRLAEKLRVAKGLYQRGWSADYVREVFRLIDWMLDLPEHEQESFRNEIFRYEEETHMPYLTSIERMAMKRGRLEELQEAIQRSLVRSFGPAAPKLMPRIRKIRELSVLRDLLDASLASKSLAEFRKHLPSEQ